MHEGGNIDSMSSAVEAKSYIKAETFQPRLPRSGKKDFAS